MRDNSFEDAPRFHVGDVGDVKPHGPTDADSSAATPNTGWTSGAESASFSVNFCKCSADKETASRAAGVSSARDVGNNLGPPANTFVLFGCSHEAIQSILAYSDNNITMCILSLIHI